MCKIQSCCCCKLPVAVIVHSAILLALSVIGMALSGSLVASFPPPSSSGASSNQTQSTGNSNNAAFLPFYVVFLLVCVVYALLAVFSVLGILGTVKRITSLLQAYYVMLILQSIFFSVAGGVVGLLTFLLWFLLILIPGAGVLFVLLVLVNIITFCIVIPTAVCVTNYRTSLTDGKEPRAAKTVIMATYADPEYNIAAPSQKSQTQTSLELTHNIETTNTAVQPRSPDEGREESTSPYHQYNYPSFPGPPTQPRGPSNAQQNTNTNHNVALEQQRTAQAGLVDTQQDYLTIGNQQEYLTPLPYGNMEQSTGSNPTDRTVNVESTSQGFPEDQGQYEHIGAAGAIEGEYETLP